IVIVIALRHRFCRPNPLGMTVSSCEPDASVSWCTRDYRPTVPQETGRPVREPVSRQALIVGRTAPTGAHPVQAEQPQGPLSQSQGVPVEVTVTAEHAPADLAACPPHHWLIAASTTSMQRWTCRRCGSE